MYTPYDIDPPAPPYQAESHTPESLAEALVEALESSDDFGRDWQFNLPDEGGIECVADTGQRFRLSISEQSQ